MTSTDLSLTTTTLSTPTTGLFSEVTQIMAQSKHVQSRQNGSRQDHDNGSLERGSTAFFLHLKELIPDKVKKYASYNKSEARVFEFKFGDECKFENCYAKDLLTRGSTIPQLQAWLDDEHVDHNTETKTRAFFVYFNMIGRNQPDQKENKYGVFVNWDRTTWTDILQRLEAHKKRRPNQHSDSRQHNNRQGQSGNRPHQNNDGNRQNQDNNRQNQDDNRQNQDNNRRNQDGNRQNRDNNRRNQDGNRRNQDGNRRNQDDNRQNQNGNRRNQNGNRQDNSNNTQVSVEIPIVHIENH